MVRHAMHGKARKAYLVYLKACMYPHERSKNCIRAKTHYLRGSNNQKAFYKRYANLLTKLKTAAKKLYFENHNLSQIILKKLGIFYENFCLRKNVTQHHPH